MTTLRRILINENIDYYILFNLNFNIFLLIIKIKKQNIIPVYHGVASD